jgi:hypothetical protein
VNTEFGEDHCGGCDQTCVGPDLKCCQGDCVNTRIDLENCGGCGSSCVGGWLCCDGDCKDPDRDEEHCGGCGQPCVGPDLECCAGACVNTRTDPLNCGRCGREGPGFGCCGGIPYDPNFSFCCPDESHVCGLNQVCCVDSQGLADCCPRP